MTIYNVYVKTEGNATGVEVYSVHTQCKMQFNVPERQRVIDHMRKNYGSIIRIDEVSRPATLIGRIDL
jgi:hypothetical protein